MEDERKLRYAELKKLVALGRLYFAVVNTDNPDLQQRACEDFKQTADEYQKLCEEYTLK
ncbi:hypothetical protein KY316_01580 [Candidatus Woesearchaeota archaeon]|nr:hypothetical protein [Candidatus Woesearchaeota archaeon]